MLTIIALTNDEKFLQFLDPDLCDIKETIETDGLRTLEFDYTFQDYLTDKELFKVGNKIWLQGDNNLTDCLYVINTEVKQDIFKENSFNFEAEEVLVELNYAPLFSHTDLADDCFKNYTTNGKVETVVDWNALNEWFGDYFNIGVVQDCISQYAQRISLTGTMTRMSLLRHIEEETGNVFVTRYEKDSLNNTIHRYLDFLNPINCDKNWALYLEYHFLGTTTLVPCEDSQGNPCSEDKPWEATLFDDDLDDESVPETVDGTDTSETETEDPDYVYDTDELEEDEDQITREYPVIANLNPANCQFQIVDENGNPVSDGSVVLIWECTDCGLDSESEDAVITIARRQTYSGIAVNEKSFPVIADSDTSEQKGYVDELKENGIINIASENRKATLIPDDSYFEIYDHENNKVLFRTQLNTEIGHVHEEILDFGFNLENVVHTIDETDTYTAVSPVLELNDVEGGSSSLSRDDLGTIITRWRNLTVTKGDVIPMIVEKVNITSTSYSGAISSLGTYNLSSNYWKRPLKPQDNTDSSDKTYEFYKAIAYWQAPYTKNAGELHVATDKEVQTQYPQIHTRPDTHNEKQLMFQPKMGTTESSDEDIYAIYNQVALYLKDHENQKIDIEVDVANLRRGTFNNYNIHDKVYLKIPTTSELITARVVKTEKEAHDISKNKVELSNHTPINTVKTVTQNTHLNGSGINFTYPHSQELSVRLENEDYDSSDQYSVQYPKNKLLAFSVYLIENGSRTFTGTTYTKLTSATGYAHVVVKLDPGIYEIDIKFAGDEEYNESSLTLPCTVGGTKTTTTTTKKTTKSKTTKKKVKKGYKLVNYYWTKYGVSPDKKQVLFIGQPHGWDYEKKGYNYRTIYKTKFKNKCPICGKAKLQFRTDIPEGRIRCSNCKSTFDGVTGTQNKRNSKKKLKILSGPTKSNKTDKAYLAKGKLVHHQTQKKIKTKTTKNKTRKARKSGLSAAVKTKAKAIVKNKTGIAAAQAIASWMDTHIRYSDYSGFKRSAATVLSKKAGNCCDQTRLFFELCDAAGCTKYLRLKYVYVSGHVYGRVITKKTGKSRPVDCASDYARAWGYICKDFRGSAVIKTTLYPNRPI